MTEKYVEFETTDHYSDNPKKVMIDLSDIDYFMDAYTSNEVTLIRFKSGATICIIQPYEEFKKIYFE